MRKLKLGLVLILLILVGLARGRAQPPPLPSPPFQKVTVCPEGPPKCDFTSIEAATGIVAGGGVIEVLPGVYVENIDIGKSLTLQGTTGVIIRARDPEQPVIYVESGVKNVTIASLMITGEIGIEIDSRVQRIAIKGNWISGINAGWIMSAIGIQIGPHAQVNIEGNDFAGLGMAIRAIAAKIDIINNIFLGSLLDIAATGGEIKILRNVTSSGGILIEGDSLTPVSANIEDNLINSIFRGLEIRAGEWGVVRLRRNTLVDNTVGGVIWARSLEAQGNYIINSDNSKALREGQGLIILATERIDLVGNVLIGNDSSGLILGVSQSGEIKVEDNIILNNGGYGLALLNPDCNAYAAELLGSIISEEEWDEIEDKFYQGQLQDEVRGSGNLIFGNKEGDLCPEDYPWPEGFVKGP